MSDFPTVRFSGQSDRKSQCRRARATSADARWRGIRPSAAGCPPPRAPPPGRGRGCAVMPDDGTSTSLAVAASLDAQMPDVPTCVPPGMVQSALDESSNLINAARSSGGGGRGQQRAGNSKNTLPSSNGKGGELTSATDALAEAVGLAAGEIMGASSVTTAAFDNTIAQLETKEYRCRILMMTVVTVTKLVVENGLGLMFLFLSITSCNQMASAIEGCVGSFDECVLPLVTQQEADQCNLRADLNAEYAQWSSACSPRAGDLMLPVVGPSAASAAMTMFFVIIGGARSVKRIRQRKAPIFDWTKNTEPELRFILSTFGQPLSGQEDKAELVVRMKKYENEGGHTHIMEDKSPLAITYEELERVKVNDVIFETIVFILAINIYVFHVEPQLSRKLDVGCGGSFCPNDMVALTKNVRCDSSSIFITGSVNCSKLWTMDSATECQVSEPDKWGCCLPIDLFFPCARSTCSLDVCDVTDVAYRSFKDMYLFNVSEDCMDLVELMFTLWSFKLGLSSLLVASGSDIKRKVAGATVIIIFTITLVVALMTILPADSIDAVPWDPKPNACAGEPCGIHGACMDLPTAQGDSSPQYQCLCENGWAGATCVVALACASSPCQAGGGACQDNTEDGSFVCVCNIGYAGELCDQVGVVGEACDTLALPNGQVSGQCQGDATRGGACVMVGCDSGYSLSHAVGTVRECQADGSWSGTTVTCVGIPCTINTVIANSDRTSDNPCVTGTGSTCIFVCNTGFHVQGLHTCLVDGRLFGGSCERNGCTSGLTLPDSPTVCDGVFEDTCTYVCNPGLSYTTPHVCGSDGVFAGGRCAECSSELQDMLNWLETDSLTFHFCPTIDILDDLGVLTLDHGKQLFVDGSGGSGGSVSINGVFRETGRFETNFVDGHGSVTFTSVVVAGTVVWAAGTSTQTTMAITGNGGYGVADEQLSLPEQLPWPANIVQTATSQSITILLDGDGRVSVIGDLGSDPDYIGRYGNSLGLGDDTPRATSPMQLSSPTSVVQVAAGRFHTMMVDSN
eukprot:COSAG02_NODE_923_length_15877_cov_26.660920_6_plen_1024_part_00